MGDSNIRNNLYYYFPEITCPSPDLDLYGRVLESPSNRSSYEISEEVQHTCKPTLGMRTEYGSSPTQTVTCTWKKNETSSMVEAYWEGDITPCQGKHCYQWNSEYVFVQGFVKHYNNLEQFKRLFTLLKFKTSHPLGIYIYVSLNMLPQISYIAYTFS